MVLALPLEEASAKVRSGPPQDDHADLLLPVWSGEIPMRTVALDAVPDPLLTNDVPIPLSVASFLAHRVPYIRSLV